MEENGKMERGLKPRHVEMIALGGTIGVGLFMGSANTIMMAGPSVLLCYALTGVVMFFIMRIMGEMLYQEPVTGSFATYGHKYISPFVGYLTAWSYWFMWVVVGLSEVTAVGIYLRTLLVPGCATVDFSFWWHAHRCYCQHGGGQVLW